jgi:hypothetical protein
MDIVQLLIQAVAGGAGGGIVGQILKSKSLQPVGNIIAGAVGGIATGQGLDAAGILSQIGPMLGGEQVAGGISALLGGGVIQAIAAQLFGKSSTTA